MVLAWPFLRWHGPSWLHSFRSLLRSLLFRKVLVLVTLVGSKKSSIGSRYFEDESGQERERKIEPRQKPTKVTTSKKYCVLSEVFQNICFRDHRGWTLHGDIVILLCLAAKPTVLPHFFKSQTSQFTFWALNEHLRNAIKNFTIPFAVFRVT